MGFQEAGSTESQKELDLVRQFILLCQDSSFRDLKKQSC